MKTLIVGLLAGVLLSANVMAANVGPYSWDETGAYVPFVIDTLANLQTTTQPRYTNEIAICTTCTGRICIASGTARNSWVAVASTATVVNAVQACH